MSTQQITKSLIEALPEVLFREKSNSSNAVSPHATFNPAASVSGTGWTNSTSPKSQPSKKTILIDANSLTYLGDLHKNTGLVCGLKALGFNIIVKTNEGKLSTIKNTNIQEIETTLTKVGAWVEEDYETLTEEYRTSRDGCVLIDNALATETTNALSKEELLMLCIQEEIAGCALLMHSLEAVGGSFCINNKERQYFLKKNEILQDANATFINLARYGSESQILNYLNDHESIDLNIRDSKGYSTLCYLASRGLISVFKNLERETIISAIHDKTNHTTPLQLAAQKGHLAIVKFLMDLGAKATNNDRGETPLLLAAQNGYTKVIEYLIDHRHDINAKNTNGDNALFLALKNGQAEVAELLIAKGIDTTHKNNEGETAHEFSKKKGFFKVEIKLGFIDYVRTHQALNGEVKNSRALRIFELWNVFVQKINRKLATKQQTRKQSTSGAKRKNNELGDDKARKSQKATITGLTDKELAEFVVETMGNSDPYNLRDNHPLSLAAKDGHFNIVKQLLKSVYGANKTNHYGHNSLLLALENNHLEIAKMLIENGIGLHYLNGIGDNALMLALKNDHREIAKMLIEKGINLSQRNRYGQTPISISEEKGYITFSRNATNKLTRETFSLAISNGVAHKSEKDSKIYLANCLSNNNRVLNTNNLENATFYMLPAGEILKGGSELSSRDLKLRTEIIQYPSIQSSLDYQKHQPSEFLEIKNIPTYSSSKIEVYKHSPSNDGLLTKFSIEIPGGEKVALPSASINESIEAIRAVARGYQVGFKVYRGDDDLFYVEADEDCTIDYVLKSELPRDQEMAYRAMEGHPLKTIIDEFIKKRNQSTGGNQKAPEYKEDAHKDWLKKVYETQAGACRHITAAIYHHVVTHHPEHKDHIRIVRINNNHQQLEIFNKDENQWVACPDTGGASANLVVQNGNYKIKKQSGYGFVAKMATPSNQKKTVKPKSEPMQFGSAAAIVKKQKNTLAFAEKGASVEDLLATLNGSFFTVFHMNTDGIDVDQCTLKISTDVNISLRNQGHLGNVLGFSDSKILEANMLANSINPKDSEQEANPLIEAVKNGDLATVELLLDRGAEIDAKDNFGNTALILAAEKDHTDTVKLLLDRGANIEANNNNSETALILAADKGHTAIVKLLLDREANIEARDSDGNTALILAAMSGHTAAVKLLLDRGAEIDAKNNIGYYTALIFAADKGHTAIVKLLLDREANIEARDSDGETALILAATNGHTAIVELLLDRGANIEAKNDYGKTPLILAATNGHTVTVELLLDCGAEIDAKNNHGNTALMLAAMNGHTAAVKLLLDRGAEIDAKDNDGETDLILAATNGHTATVELLLDCGAEIDAKGSFGMTALTLAADKGYTAIVKLLLDRGANIEANTNKGKTPLILAVDKGHTAIVKLLLDRGAEIDAKDNETVLISAAFKGHTATVELLLDRGAEIDAKGSFGNTALMFAADNGHTAAAKLLLDRGADIDAKDNDGETALSIAKQEGNEDVVAVLESFQQGVDPHTVLVLDLRDADPADLVKLNTLYDLIPSLRGHDLPYGVKILTILPPMTAEQKTAFAALISRHGPETITIIEETKEKKVPINHGVKTTTIDIQGLEDWQSVLFGQVILKENKIVWEKSDFVKALEAGKEANFEVKNLPPAAIKEFKLLLDVAKGLGEFSYHGYKIPLDVNKVNIKLNASKYNFSQFKSGVNIQTAKTIAQCAPESLIINSFNFDQLVAGKSIDDQGMYNSQPGLIEKNQGNTLQLFINAALTETQWYCLLAYAKENEVSLEINTILKANELPKGLSIQSTETMDSLQTSNKKLQTPKITVTNAPDQVEFEDDTIVIPVEDYSSQQLWFGVDKAGEFNKKTNLFEAFTHVDSPIKKALESGKKVALVGEFSESLLQHLAPVMSGREVPNAHHLSFVIEADIEASTKVYEPLNWLPEGSVELRPKTSNQTISQKEIYQEPKPTTVNQINNPEAAKDFIAKRIQKLGKFFEKTPLVQLLGAAGVGKSSLLREYGKHSTVQTFQGLESLKAWAAKPSNPAKKHVLVLDEANMDNQHYTMFKGLLSGKGHIIVNDEIIEIGKHCQVAFMMNPTTDENGLEFGGGRAEQKLFETTAIPQMVLENFPDPYVYCNLLKAPIYDQLTQQQQSQISEHDFQALCQPLIKDYQNGKNTVRMLQEKVRHQLLATLEIENYPGTPSDLKTADFFATAATNRVQLQLEQAIEVRRLQYQEEIPKSLSGQPGVVIEGKPGLGKSEMIRAVLAQKNIPIVKLIEERDKHQNKQCCYKIDASHTTETITAMICKAFENGDMVWIDEFNSIVNDIEKVLNAAMTGVHPITGETANKPGFMMIGSINPAHMSGREVVSHALESRYSYAKMPDMNAYKPEDLKAIVENMANGALNEQKIEEIAEKLTTGEIKNFRECKLIISLMKSNLNQKRQGSTVGVRDGNRLNGPLHTYTHRERVHKLG